MQTVLAPAQNPVAVLLRTVALVIHQVVLLHNTWICVTELTDPVVMLGLR
jgi:hypothetical protein